jgi:RhtB (resistance to homoserine/threonine) family protein
LGAAASDFVLEEFRDAMFHLPDSMSYWSEFVVVAGIHLVAVASPGPDFALVLRQSVNHGRRVAIVTSLGIGAGIMVHVTLSLLGIGVLLRSSELVFSLVKYAGAAYIAWLGLRGLLAKPRTAGDVALSEDAPPAHGAFLTGFIVNVLNPKAALFFVGLFLTAVSPLTPKSIQVLYGIWLTCATAAWFTMVSIVFTRAIVRQTFLRVGHWFDRAMGVLLLALAARLALATLR